MISAATAAAVEQNPPGAARDPRPRVHKRKDFTNEAAAGATLLLLLCLGALGMLPVSANVVRLWSDDPLRSFGALLPPIALVLWVARWRATGWTRNGNAWGLLPVAFAILVARTYGASLIAYSFGQTEIAPLQPGLLYFAYGSGIALLLGGTRLWRAVLFPLCLLLCVDPVPHLFDRLDFPLQEASAGVARAFSHAIGLQPTGAQLQMMFAPRFGMVIVPGCNGVRGSATMLYLALLIGEVRRFRWQRTTLLMLGGFVLGYLLNFVRLCCLVVYYRLALQHLQWRTNGETVDYCIGGALFLLVCTLAGFLLLRPEDGNRTLPTVHLPRVPWGSLLRTPRSIVAVVLLLAAALPELPSAYAAIAEPSDYIEPAVAQSQLPAQLGQWQRGELWTEIYYGRPVWQWAAYRRTDGRSIDVGVWLSPKRHYAIQSRRMSGSKPVVGGDFETTAASGTPMQLSTFTLDDATAENSAPIPTFFAETTCLPDHCGGQEIGFKRRGWLIAVTPLSAREQRRLPMIFRVQSPPGVHEDAATRQANRALIGDFSRNLDVHALVERLGAR